MKLSGRAVSQRKTRVDEARSIDMLELQRKGVFTKGPAYLWTCTWSRNNEVTASVSYQLIYTNDVPSGIRLSYQKTTPTNETRVFSYIIPLESTRCNYGGNRWWFTCPLIIDGKRCGRRCRIIYLPDGAAYFGCRECYQLTYESRQKRRDKFYEDFEKPYLSARSLLKEFNKARAGKKKDRLWEKLTTTMNTLEKFTPYDLIRNNQGDKK